MYVTEAHQNGCILVYRSGRRGFSHYLMGKFNCFKNISLLILCSIMYQVVIMLFGNNEDVILSGQLQQVAKEHFNLDVETTIIETEFTRNNNRSISIVTLKLQFDNSEYVTSWEVQNCFLHSFMFQMCCRTQKHLHIETRKLQPFSCGVFLTLFPFAILINPKLEIKGLGEKLAQVLEEKGDILGRPITQYFRLRRPKGIPFTWKNVSN